MSTSAAEGVGAVIELVGADEVTSERNKQEDLKGSGSLKKHKKHKKHKSKKRRRNREKEISSESERGTKHQPR